MPTYYWKNKQTEEIIEVFRALDDYQIPPEQIPEEELDQWFRLIQKPQIFKSLIPEGFGIRQNDAAWQNGKEIARLEENTYDMPHTSKERAEIKKEIKKIERSSK